ncbi:hypothetical protein AVEN_223073-1, partial [Araneus ventricosus]
MSSPGSTQIYPEPASTRNVYPNQIRKGCRPSLRLTIYLCDSRLWLESMSSPGSNQIYPEPVSTRNVYPNQNRK